MSFYIGELGRGRIRTDERGTEYVRRWKVFQLNDVTGACESSTPSEILDAVESTIKYGDPYSDDKPDFVCNSIEHDAVDDDNEIYEVTATYGAEDKEDEPDNFDDFMDRSNGPNADDPNNPFAPEFSSEGMTVDEYRVFDLDGMPFVNSAGSPFQNVPPIPVTIQVDRVTVSERTRADIGSQGRADGQYMLAYVASKPMIHYSKSSGVTTRYYRNTYVRYYHPYFDWAHISLLNVGFMELNDSNKKVNIKDADGHYVTEPAALEVFTGKKKADGEPASEKFFRIRDIGPLNIPFLG